MTTSDTSKLYYIEQGQLDKLRTLSDQLHGGSDRERDYGHRLWLVLGEVQSQPVINLAEDE
jgi:hypothetical protein